MSCSHRPSFVLRRCRSHEAVHRGEISGDVALDRLERIWQIRIRYLGDAVLRRNAWKVAERMGWAATYTAEYVALTRCRRTRS